MTAQSVDRTVGQAVSPAGDQAVNRAAEQPADPSVDRNPFVGPRPFRPEDSDYFFGRRREARDVASLIVANRTLLIYSQSGAGKTSLINAGVPPLLVAKGCEALPPARVQGRLPEGVSPDEVSNRYVFNVLMEDHFLRWAGETDPCALTKTSLAAFLARKPHVRNPDGKPSLRVLFFDQFEELFSLYEECWPQRQDFFVQVRDALDADPLLRIVFVMREDTLVKLDQRAPVLPDNLRARFYLEKLRLDAAREAIIGPLGMSSKVLAVGVAEQLADSLAPKLLEIRVEDENGKPISVVGEFVEPVQLQIVCFDLWRALPRKVTSIKDAGTVNLDVEQSLENYYEQAIKAAADKTQIHQNRLRQLCGDYLITCTGARNLVHAASLAAQGAPADLLPELEAQHLIQPEWRAGSLWYELMHDCLVKPILQSNERWNAKCNAEMQEAYTDLQRAYQRLYRPKVNNRDYEFALTKADAALAISREIDSVLGIVQMLNAKGDLLAYLQRPGSLECYAEALDLERQYGDEQGIAQTTGAMAAVYQSGNEFDKAAECLGEPLALPNLPVDQRALILVDRAWAYWYGQHYKEAVRDYSEALKIDDQMFTAYNGRGQVLAEMGRYAKALADLDKALSLGKDDPVGSAYAHNGRGLAQAGLRHFEKAIEEFNASSRVCPDNAWVYFNRAQMYEWMDKQQQAIADYKTALAKQDPPLTPLKREHAQARLQALSGS